MYIILAQNLKTDTKFIIMNVIKKYKLHIIFTGIGTILGFIYWRYVGCNSGSCPLTSVWYNSSIYGGILGLLSGSILKDELKKRNNNNNEQIQ